MTLLALMTGGVVGLGLASVLVVALRGVRSDAELLFAVFCGSLAMAMLRPALDEAPAALLAVVTLGACATCNVYWLLSRALFRGDGGVRRRHVAAAAGVAVLIVLYRGADAASLGPGVAVLGDLLALVSSTVLVLAFIEALRGWSAAMPAAEKRLRLGFMVVYGACVLSGTASGAVAASEPAWAEGHRLLVLCCATTVVLGTHVALAWRRRHPWRDAVVGPSPQSPAASPAARGAPSADDCVLGEAILRVLVQRELYREPDLKVADLAAAVGSVEHKVSRAITQALGERNFHQLVNRYRIAHACRMLAVGEGRSVLDVSLESGFASLGPFNRAFKATTGQTPTEWRAARQNARPSTDDPSTCPSS